MDMDRTVPDTLAGVPARARTLSGDLERFLRGILGAFPWEVQFEDWTGRRYELGRKAPHWRGLPLRIRIGTPAAARDLLGLRALRFLDRFLAGEVDMTGNLYHLQNIRNHAGGLELSRWRLLLHAAWHGGLLFQNERRARVNVKTHYDIPQEALALYLDREYLSYSCGMFERPEEKRLDDLLRAGTGEADRFDSLEKAQWRKFADAADFMHPAPGERVLDVGCGYGGQLRVVLDRYPAAHVVGWTHSSNQVTQGSAKLAAYPRAHWELHEGDFREETRRFDHIASTGMVSHVGPRGLVPYVREIRRRIRRDGRYLHHALMTPWTGRPLDAAVGVAFNKRYVWPGFHWFTLGEHVKALEENGFELVRLTNLSPHYSKTTAAWYERMMAQADRMRALLGEQTFRAWQVYLASASEGFVAGTVHVYRLYCRAV
jgi:cyclopropane-fatty-acyl-phospholipid synthase